MFWFTPFVSALIDFTNTTLLCGILIGIGLGVVFAAHTPEVRPRRSCHSFIASDTRDRRCFHQGMLTRNRREEVAANIVGEYRQALRQKPRQNSTAVGGSQCQRLCLVPICRLPGRHQGLSNQLWKRGPHLVSPSCAGTKTAGPTRDHLSVTRPFWGGRLAALSAPPWDRRHQG